jgi:hypothetical protein
MKRLALLFALVALSVPAAARAQVAVQIQVGLPVAPPLVVVQPGIQVVEDYHEEVFFTGGWYWVRRDGGWYRARTPRAAFVFVEPRRVPVALVRIPPGQYRHWRREDHHEWKEHQKAERRAWKAHEKAERREWKEAKKHGGHGHGHHDD